MNPLELGEVELLAMVARRVVTKRRHLHLRIDQRLIGPALCHPGRYRLASVCGAKKQRIVICGEDVQM